MNKTLVCVLAETRTYSASWGRFKKNVLDELRADLLLCIGVPHEYDFSNPFWQFAKYKCTAPEFVDWADAYDEVQQVEWDKASGLPLPNWRMLLEIKDQWLGGIKGKGQHLGSGSILYYFRWLLLQYIRNEDLLNKYDRFVITRSDFIWDSPHPPISSMSASNLWIPDGEAYGGVTDRHAVLSRENIVQYLDLISAIVKEPDTLYSAMQNFQNWNPESFINLSIKQAKLEEKVKFFPYVMYAVREWGGSTRWSSGLWSDALGLYIKYNSEFQSAESAVRIFKNKKDWLRFFNNDPSIGFNVRVTDEQGNVFIEDSANRLKAINIANIKTANHTRILSVDYVDNVGYLYMSEAGDGYCNKTLLDSVELACNDLNRYSFKSRKDGCYYTITSDGGVEMSETESFNLFLTNKYAYDN